MTRGRHSRWSALAVVLSGAVLVVLETSKLNVALPRVSESLQLSALDVQLVMSGFTLIAGLSLVPFGRLGDAGFRQAIFVSGAALFAVSSAVCTFTPDGTGLVVGRLLQGVATGMIMPQTVGLIQTEFRGPERVRVFALFGVVFGLANALGPALGGAVLLVWPDVEGWRWMFALNLPAALVVGAGGALVLRRESRQPISLDPVGMLLLGFVALLVLFPFVVSGGPGTSPFGWLTLPLAVLVIVAMARWERSVARGGGRPIISPAMIGNRPFRWGVLVGFGWYASTPALLLIATLFVQQGLGFDPFVSGIVVAPFAIAAALGSALVGRASRIGVQVLVRIGLVLALAGVVAALLSAVVLSGPLAAWALVAAHTVAGLGGGLATTSNQLMTLHEVPPAHGGNAGSVQQLTQRLAGAMGLAAVIAVATGLGASLAPLESFVGGLIVCAGFLVVSLALSIRRT